MIRRRHHSPSNRALQPTPGGSCFCPDGGCLHGQIAERAGTRAPNALTGRSCFLTSPARNPPANDEMVKHIIHTSTIIQLYLRPASSDDDTCHSKVTFLFTWCGGTSERPVVVRKPRTGASPDDLHVVSQRPAELVHGTHFSKLLSKTLAQRRCLGVEKVRSHKVNAQRKAASQRLASDDSNRQ